MLLVLVGVVAAKEVEDEGGTTGGDDIVGEKAHLNAVKAEELCVCVHVVLVDTYNLY